MYPILFSCKRSETALTLFSQLLRIPKPEVFIVDKCFSAFASKVQSASTE